MISLLSEAPPRIQPEVVPSYYPSPFENPLNEVRSYLSRRVWGSELGATLFLPRSGTETGARTRARGPHLNTTQHSYSISTELVVIVSYA